jgi:membrane-associated protease RseP (regulator of RpoE activity)
MKRKNIIIIASLFVASVLMITVFSGCSISQLAFNSMQMLSKGMNFKGNSDYMENRGYKENGNGSGKRDFGKMPCLPEDRNSLDKDQSICNDLENTPFMGIEMVQPENDVKGVLVNSVISGSPAQEAGVREMDIITAADGKEINSPADLSQAVLGHKIGETIKVTVNRDGQSQEFGVVLESMSNVLTDTEKGNQSSESYKGCGNCPRADENQNNSNCPEKSGQNDNETY